MGRPGGADVTVTTGLLLLLAAVTLWLIWQAVLLNWPGGAHRRRNR